MQLGHLAHQTGSKNQDWVKWSALDEVRVGVKYTKGLPVKVDQDDMGMYRRYINFQQLLAQASVGHAELKATTNHGKYSILGQSGMTEL
jgi:argininosuccinate synthase